MEWQDIETAPKDGTTVDLWVQPCEDAPDEYKFDNPPRRAANCYYHDYTWHGGGRWPMEPTHWMPLPSPPKPSNSQSGS
jgi:hypothetical protein